MKSKEIKGNKIKSKDYNSAPLLPYELISLASSRDMEPIILPIWLYTPSMTRPVGRVTAGNTASDASVGRVTRGL